MELNQEKNKSFVALYSRVSTIDQTTENQDIILIDYCKKMDYNIYNLYKDLGVSGAKTSRPELDKMLQDMRLRKFDTIIVWKLDRLGRSLQHLLSMLQEFQNKGIRLICLDMNIDTGTPQGKFFFSVVGAFAELEREIITQRVRAGVSRAKAQGKHMGRPKGSKDSRKRNPNGYYERWENERKAKWKSEKPTPSILDKNPL